LDGQLRTTRQARNYEAEERRAEDWKEGRELRPRHPFSVTFNAIREATGMIDAASQRIDEARRFSGQADLQRIAQWSQLEAASAQPRIRHAVGARGRTLTHPSPCQ
jgi:hypothetical protein